MAGGEDRMINGEHADIDVGPCESADMHAPLLTSYHQGCPACMLESKKAASHDSLPLRDLSVVALLYLSNALPICSLYSFVYFMVKDLDVAKSETQIGSYSGYLGSALLVGRFLTSAPWGIIADKYGHKVVIYVGTATIFTFNTIFGFSTNYCMALTSRFLLGLGNGLTGTLTAYACEICRQEHQAVAMSIMGTMWGFGLIVGPAIGGYLAEPSQKLPALFPSGSLFDRFPYALPCIFISAIAVAAFFLSFLLPETRHNHVTNGVIFEDKILKVSKENISNEGIPVSKQPLWNNWGLMASITLISCWVVQATAYSETFSLWAVSPKSYGGLVFTSSEVAHVLAVSGAAILLFQLLLFPLFANRVGAIELVHISALLTTILVVLYPLFHKLQGAMLWTVVLLVSTAKNILSVSGLTGIFIIINNSVENAQRGVANGLSASIMSAFQAFAPAFAGAMHVDGFLRFGCFLLRGLFSNA